MPTQTNANRILYECDMCGATITQPTQVRYWDSDRWIDLCSIRCHVELLQEEVAP